MSQIQLGKKKKTDNRTTVNTISKTFVCKKMNAEMTTGLIIYQTRYNDQLLATITMANVELHEGLLNTNF